MEDLFFIEMVCRVLDAGEERRFPCLEEKDSRQPCDHVVLEGGSEGSQDLPVNNREDRSPRLVV